MVSKQFSMVSLWFPCLPDGFLMVLNGFSMLSKPSNQNTWFWARPHPQDTFKAQIPLRLPIRIHGSGRHKTASKLKCFFRFPIKIYMVPGPSYHPQDTFKTQLSLTPSNQNTCFWGPATTYKTPSHIIFAYAFQSKYMVMWPCPHPQDTFQTRFALRLPIKIRLAVKTTASLVFAMPWGLLCFGPHPKPTFSKRGMGP